MTKSIFQLLALISFLLISYSYTSAQVQSKNGTYYKVSKEKQQENKIQYLHFQMSYENGKEQLKFISSKIKPGTLKEAFASSLQRPHHMHKHDVENMGKTLLCAIKNHKKKIVFEKELAHPLHAVIEFPMSEESKKMESQFVDYTTKDFFIRIPYDQDAEYISFSIQETNQEKSNAHFEFPIH